MAIMSTSPDVGRQAGPTATRTLEEGKSFVTPPPDGTGAPNRFSTRPARSRANVHDRLDRKRNGGADGEASLPVVVHNDRL